MANQDNKLKLFVGGLNRSTTEEAIQKYFESYGPVQVKVVKNPETGQSKGFAFLSFNDNNALEQVQSARPHKIDGRAVGTKRVLPKDENGQSDTSEVKKLFIGGIKGQVEEDELRTTFAEYGKVVKVSIPTNKETGKQKGFVFIEYDDSDSVDKAIVYKDDIRICGNKVGVNKAIEKDQQYDPYMRGGRGGRGGGMGRGGYGRGGYEDMAYGYPSYDAYGDGYSRGGGMGARGRGGRDPYSRGGYGNGYTSGYGDYDAYGGGYDQRGYGRGGGYY